MDMNTPPDLSIDQVMSRRFELDEQVSLLQGRHKLELAPLVEELKLCETFIRTELLASGTQQWKSSTTGHSTHFTTKSRCNVIDFDATLACIREQGLWHLLTKAISKEAVKEYIDEHKEPPPGVKFEQFKDLSWVRGKA